MFICKYFYGLVYDNDIFPRARVSTRSQASACAAALVFFSDAAGAHPRPCCITKKRL
ncbi:hypothetical protein KDH_19090 [Dictyobacter sp. S3.2.2.5]|uniref:Uncharacterized protein n=1 Tax=Dictyobacter halimunensis TaxID=3026934 RepID=A0ABQ6FMZ3_9CHLR|nr:hypothetical protein KDH_19090 [Dictyobacter sp. S3.2.2.5]